MRKLLFVCFLAAAGCTPYNSTYMCEASRDYGKCSDVRGAYDAALGTARPERINQETEQSKGRKKDKKEKRQELSSVAMSVAQAHDMYRAREYQQLAALIDQPTVPLVKMPTALRTLVVSYSTGKTLFMPRYIYVLDDEANFVFGDYLTPRDAGGPMIFPNGGGQAPTTTKTTTPPSVPSEAAAATASTRKAK